MDWGRHEQPRRRAGTATGADVLPFSWAASDNGVDGPQTDSI